MITNKSRAFYFGASDTKFIVSNWETETFKKWWLEKLDLHQNKITNKYMSAGTHFEHKIIDALEIEEVEKDRQIIIEELRLRVNLDANTKEKIIEIKTYYYHKDFYLSKNYINQVLVQMYADNKREAEIVAYGLLEEDYRNFFNEIDKKRLSIYKIEYDKNFIEREYLPKLKYLARKLIAGEFPNREEFERFN